MKKFLSFVILFACNDEVEDNLNEVTASSSSIDNVEPLEKMNLENQNDFTVWNQGEMVLPESNSIDEIQRVKELNTDKAGVLEVQVLNASYFGGNDLEEKSLECEYIFVATVEDFSFNYFDYVYDENGELIDAIPETTFHVKVLGNIKGELPKGSLVEIKKGHFWD